MFSSCIFFESKTRTISKRAGEDLQLLKKKEQEKTKQI